MKHTCNHCNYKTNKICNFTRHLNRWGACRDHRYKEMLVENRELVDRMERKEREHFEALRYKTKELEKKTKEFSKTLRCKTKEFSKTLRCKTKEFSETLRCKTKELEKKTKELERRDKEISLLRKKLQRKNNKIATLESKKATHITNINNNNLIQFILDTKFFQDRIDDYTRDDYMNAVQGAVRFAVSALNDGDGKRYICSDPARRIFKYVDENGQCVTDIGGARVWDAMKGPVTAKAEKTRDDLLAEHPENFELINDPLAKLKGKGNAPPRGFSAELASNTKE